MSELIPTAGGGSAAQDWTGCGKRRTVLILSVQVSQSVSPSFSQSVSHSVIYRQDKAETISATGGRRDRKKCLKNKGLLYIATCSLRESQRQPQCTMMQSLAQSLPTPRRRSLDLTRITLPGTERKLRALFARRVSCRFQSSSLTIAGPHVGGHANLS